MGKGLRLVLLVVWTLACAACAGTGDEIGLRAGAIPAAGYSARQGPLDAREMQMARQAWVYFQNNYQPSTGFVNAVDGYPSTTMWDTASYLGALVAARNLGLIDKLEFDDRLGALLKTLNSLDLFHDELPNKAYNTQTAQKVNYANQPGEIGYSALDLGRLLIWLKITEERYPEHANAIDRVVSRWNFTHVVDGCGTLYGATVGPDKQVQYVQEGRLGYEEYGASGFQLWGFSTCLASRPEPYSLVPIFCVDVPFDTRDPRDLAQHNYVVSESYVLYGLELGWARATDRHAGRQPEVSRDTWVANFAQRIYQAQENRFVATGILTARSEHQLDGDPYFVYDTIYSDGYPWNTITDKGAYVPQFAAISTKAAVGMWVLWNSPYTDRLADAVWGQYQPAKGYYEGILENGKGPIKAFTANNNGIMLEALMFKSQGRLLRFNEQAPQPGGRQPALWERTLTDPFDRENLLKSRPRAAARGQAGCGAALVPFGVSACSQSCQCPTCQDDAPFVLPAFSQCH
ncbi:hypothetical protein BLA23254_07476 [Burkholderia lata]|uniref:DUF3131 domain-containing protein n=1 Tax=Burkholderia lata (strain ATCC 17760 / DSM 23089 / LMG 22485 / NCIMB 9086 / R18194 / 383) TaxID=482957 RepID=A0A6P2SHE5_BURL3|nr:DUF3131 domain-containing protein [Burkholderia lata]VWC47427.1 hypothetical protein BLA23254_07476 [Burkholderia lata]